ncbi:thioredoxin [Leptolinea tardivitalis]|uniref:Thioredoxin n=1 Tax=Leptolinea tardivitalis TaxID=229920 RepID=A0A0P6WNS2_9CHLR|nr:thioredoxin [Leptolinea tardivitalis]KPL70460.1 hypothetical protein ADM99_15090 [Leptolinea tardivitalis]GAP22047.1 thioredoxin [Leptolinea tardivitalis]
MSNLPALQTPEFASKVQKATLPVILDFSANWCSPCKRLAPILESLAEEWSGKASFFSVDADTNSDLVMQFGVMSLPTLVIFKRGKEVGRMVGLQSREKLIEFVSPHL